jgi:hypothetical protein
MLNHSCRIFASILVCVLLLLSGHTKAQTPALSFNGYTPAWEYTQSSYVIGWYFQPTAPISVSALGWYNDRNGLSSDHPVGIYDIQSGQYVATTVVRTTDPLTGVFRYRDLAVPVTLTSGRQYAIVGVSYRDHYLSFAQIHNLVLASSILYLGGAIDYAGNATQLGPPVQYFSGAPYWPATNFKFSPATTATTISSITPDSARVNSAAFLMTIAGTNFTPNSIVRFNSAQMAIVSSTSTSLQIQVPAHLLTIKRTYNVTVSTNGRVSNVVAFRVTDSGNTDAPPNLQRVGNFRTGMDSFSGGKYAVLLFENRGGAPLTNINFSDFRLYYDRNDRTRYVMPTIVTLEQGAVPAGTLSSTPPGFRLQVRFDFPTTILGPVQAGTLSMRGTSDQGAFNAGSVYLIFP